MSQVSASAKKLGEAAVVALQPTAEAPPDQSRKTQDLKQAFELFNDMSQQLVESYHLLENRVTELNRELISVSDQRMQELAAKEQLAHRLESLLSFLPGGVVVLDSTGRVSECNPAALELLGEPLQSELWREVIARSFMPRRDDGHEVSLHDGRRISIATRDLGVDGQIILLTDQTETRRLQHELSRHERLSALGKMMSALAHQIRTPLSAAMLYAGHLCNADLPEQRRQDFAEKISGRLNHIERQVQDMLLFVKGELPLSDFLSVTELQLALEEAMEVPLMTSQSKCTWDVQCRDKYLQCNREALVGALMNLVDNGIQAVGKGARLHFSFTSAAVDDTECLVISVTDQGPGIAPDLMPNLGDLFVTTKAQGTGLGLAVVKAVARAHRGGFDLQSEPGRGTCARMVLPLAAV